MEQNLFEEKQYFRQWWLKLILFVINGQFLYGFYQQIINNIPYGNHPMSNTGLTILTFLFLIFTLFFLKINLQTRISNVGIYIKFWPFLSKEKCYAWKDIVQCEVCTYSPFLDYGGWGLRFGLKGKAFNIAGNKGIKIKFKNKINLLIGTQKPIEVEKILLKLSNEKEF